MAADLGVAGDDFDPTTWPGSRLACPCSKIPVDPCTTHPEALSERGILTVEDLILAYSS